MLYVALEGIDGIGKTTLHKQLLERFHQEFPNANIVGVHEPYNPKLNDIISSIMEQKYNDEQNAEIYEQQCALLYAQDRLNNMKIINQYHDIVISDRSIYSSLAYQQLFSTSSKWIKKINKHMKKPDYTILLDAPVEYVLNRIKKNMVFEQKEILHQTRQNYIELAKTEDNFSIIKVNKVEDPLELAYEKIYKKYNENHIILLGDLLRYINQL